ncbi:MAG TPA: bifunctional glycosyltransferase/class I SAM-dependent methyltransferase [Candidatus Acidoferrum sp.]|nr:bifunctional glycosyltransferase/class I SAM-dependent methyltransferase [Candidatus Acidoferrum sp.]
MTNQRLLSIIVPVYNEEEFLAAAIQRALNAPLPDGLVSELIAVDDGSTDSSPEILAEIAAQYPDRVRVIRHARNSGKGAAIRTGLQHASGEFGIIQDADLEYDPAEYPKVLGPLISNKADVVYGSRFLISGERRVIYYWHSLANHILTTACNMAADLNLTDMETCYKAFRLSLARSIPIRSNRFGIEPEITIKFAKRQASIYEVPISYYGRTYDEGKKIGAADALSAMWVILRGWLTRDIYADPGAHILDSLSGTKRFNRWMADVIRPYLGVRVLELGAGIGNMSQHLSRGRRSYMATDLDEEHLGRLRVRFQGRPNLSCRRVDLTAPSDFDELRGRFDTVVCLNVVEHVEDDLLALRNIRSALEPGGCAVVLVPQDQSVYGTLDEVLGHYRRYSAEQLRKRMEEAGFQVERVFEFNQVTRPGWWLNGRILKRRSFGRMQLRVFDALVPVWRRLDGMFPWRGVSVIGVGKVPKGNA